VAKIQLPKIIYVRQETEEAEEPFLIACESVRDAVDGDGPTVVGTYELIDIRKMIKRVDEE
jgi:hypothetical protein